MAEIPGRFSIGKMLRKETHDIFVIQGIQLFDRICESIHHSVHLLHLYVLIDVSAWCISTSNQVFCVGCRVRARQPTRPAPGQGQAIAPTMLRVGRYIVFLLLSGYHPWSLFPILSEFACLDSNSVF